MVEGDLGNIWQAISKLDKRMALQEHKTYENYKKIEQLCEKRDLDWQSRLDQKSKRADRRNKISVALIGCLAALVPIALHFVVDG